MTTKQICKAILFSSLCFGASAYAQLETTGLVRVNAFATSQDKSFIEKGTGILRYSETGVALSQAVLGVDVELASALTWHSVLNGYSDGDQRFGVTQSYVEYRPLSPNKIKWQIRGGFFYPSMSVENTDVGWLSPTSLSNSAINSWIGEELRVPGIEVSLYSPGRPRRSPWTWHFDLGVYKGNDTLGTLLTWRGWSLHDRQSLHNDRIQFAPIPSVTSDYSPINGPSWTEPFTEIDGNIGFYTGVKLQYLRKLDMRYFYYDNRADPTQLDENRLYAWHTRFHSLAARYQWSKALVLAAQAMTGDTLMGDNIVQADFHAAYVSLTQQVADISYTLRFDWFQVVEDDALPRDWNDNLGRALTLSMVKPLSDSLTLNLEWQINKNWVESRRSFDGPEEHSDQLWQAALTYRF